MPQFHETGYGRTFLERQLPDLIRATEKIADALEEQNKRQKEERDENSCTYTCVVIKDGKVINVLASKDEHRIMKHAKDVKMDYGGEGISQIVAYRSHPDGVAERMFEYIPE
jgi:hypothetical protein